MNLEGDATKRAQLHKLCFSYPRPWSAQEFAALDHDPSSICIEHDVGFLIGRVIVDEAEILTLAVDPTQRRRGIARNLVAEFHTVVSARGAVEAFLEVAADNDAAIRLYEASGYVQAGVRSRYYRTDDGTSVDAIVMRCPLS